MPINILISDIKFFNEFKNDVGFVSNLGDFTLNLAGSVMENVRALYQVDVNWFAAVTSNDTWTADVILQRIGRSSGNWYNDGFSIGDICDWLQNGVPTANITINSISQDGKTFYYTLNSGSITDSNNAQLNGLTPLTSLINKFGLIGNSETFNVTSKVSGNAQGYYTSSIGLGSPRSTAFVTMQRLGQYEDWRTGEMKARFVSNPQPNIQRFEIQHDFTIVPYYLDGELTNLQNNIIPNLLSGLNSLKYAINPEFRVVLSNPNTAKSTEIDNQLGSIAWFNENFNGFNNNYQINSVTYTEQATAASADGLLVGAKTRVTIQVEKLNGNFVVGDRVGAYVSYLPEQIEYQNTTLSDLKDNFIYDNAFQSSGSSGANGQDFITNMTVFSPSGNLMTLYFDVEYNATQKAFLSNKFQSNDPYFIIGIELGDNTLTSGNADRVILLADIDVYDESPDIPGLMDIAKFDIYPHDEQIGVGSGSTNMVSWNEDGLVVDYDFSLNLNQSAVLNSLDFRLLAYNTITQQFFNLDTFNFNVGTAIVSGGVQQINYNTTRNYILKSGDQFNDMTIQVGANVGGQQHYTGRFAQKISWQDWLLNLGVDTIFYDNTKPNNNLNFKSSNYSLLNDYEIRLGVFANLSGVNQFNVSGVTDYLFLSPNIQVFDYTKDGNPTPIWSCLIETFDNVTLTNLNGAVLTGSDTLFRATWTNSGGAVASLSGIWGINRLEETGQAGYDITEMSSLNDPATNQILIPNSGTKLFMYLNAGKVVMECLINGNSVSAGQEYNLSSRIHDVNVAGGKQEESGVLKLEEIGTSKIVE